ncbi:MAG TPA: glutamate--tRNA ligase family protein, partial [Patescibacteria group bacterium]|nr:glutamate--tRNA ligase family protein [Patescibacteria group bacterium]
MSVVTRFAPSPTGRLHIGHAYSALFAQQQAQGGRFILRIEDIDVTRCKPEFEQGIYEDLSWLGLTWEQPVRRQSEHLPDYAEALHKLQEQELVYPCFCTRKDIADEIEISGVAPHGPEGQLYPGICRKRSANERRDKIAAGLPYAWRLDVEKSMKALSLQGEGLGEGKSTGGAIPHP